MILKALADYYQRLFDDPNIEIAPPGFELKSIDYIVVIDNEGKFINFRDVRKGTGRRRNGRPTLVPKGVKRAANILPNLLWDTAPYSLGRALPDKNRDFEELSFRAVKQHAAFVEKIEQIFEGSDDCGIQALLTFLHAADFKPIFQHEIWTEIENSGGNISFSLSDDPQLICQRKKVVARLLETNQPQGKTQTCLVSGICDVPAKLHTAIKGVWGAQASGANVVSFNLDAFRSFGKKQGNNAPVGRQTEFGYTTALNYLLASGNQRMQVGDASTVFWAKEASSLESDLPAYLAPKKGEEAVSYGKIRVLLSAVKSGISPEEEELPFYVLGLAPNASRISIRFWYAGNVKEIKERVAEHFEDISIVSGSNDSEFLSLHQLLLSTVPIKESERSKKIPPNLGGEVVRAVLTGTSYPRTLFSNAVRRCKTEQKVTYARAAVIKGFLARNARITNSTQKEVTMALDKNYDNIGYVLGRLFAVLERIQEQAQGRGLNKTIRDTYFGAAGSSPIVTFKRLQDLAIHHLAKIRNSGKSTVWLEQLMQEVSGHIPPQGIPSILRLEDQGRFSIGYYHQRQDFFTKKENETKGEE